MTVNRYDALCFLGGVMCGIAFQQDIIMFSIGLLGMVAFGYGVSKGDNS